MTAVSTSLAPDPIRWAITRALAALVALGTVDRIADRLAQQGIRGVCGNPVQCALAVYIETAVPGIADGVLYVDQTRVDVTWAVPDRDQVDDVVYVPMPALLGAFVRRFDAEDFPGLLAADSPRSAPQPF